ncbi:MAG: class I SAM-dependent methyltransferase [Bacillati bacterium ANGP1]|uniref:Class I SAM-dependent methyltransferase n=1 Tax=Candidatus Segetimicrobium genomatis TaxID=2569760 RepID=A0A537JF55_9BACT|nr:MAG: class I SAM-dependent methyltransferase [Terrabacteria group bacterium ANGP1]
MSSIYRRYAEAYVKAGQGRWSLQLVPWATAVFERNGAAPTSLVDVACGSGEFALAMAQRGLRVTGVDQSPDMLAIARRSAQEKGVAITFLEQDMRRLSLPAPVDAASCLYDSLNYLISDVDLRQTLHAVATSLRPGGLFLFDMNTILGLATRWGNRVWLIQDNEDALEVDQSEFDYDAGIATLKVNAFLRRDQELYERVREIHRERGYPVPTIDAELRAAGFEILGRWSSPEFGEVTPQTGRVFYAARRPSAVTRAGATDFRS